MDYKENVDVNKQKRLIEEFTKKFSEKLKLREKVENSYKLEERLDEIIRELDIHGKFFSLFHELNYQRVVNSLNKQSFYEHFVPDQINQEYKNLIEIVEASTYFTDDDLNTL